MVMLGTVVGAADALQWGLVSAVVDLTWGFPLLLVAVIVVGILTPGLTSVIVAVAVMPGRNMRSLLSTESTA